MCSSHCTACICIPLYLPYTSPYLHYTSPYLPQVLLALHRVLRSRMSLDKHKRLLTALHARCDASARFWNTGASDGALRVLVAGGGPVRLRARDTLGLR